MDIHGRRDPDIERLYRIVCEHELTEAAEIMRHSWPDHLQPYDAERRIIAAYKNERAA